MRNLLLFLLLMLCVGGGLNDANPLARIFTDNPFVDEKKFEEAGKNIYLIITRDLLII